MLAEAIGCGSHSTNRLIGRCTELALDDLGGQLGAHRRRIRLQLGERNAHRLGKPFVDVAGHLAELHQRSLHVAETIGNCLGGAQLAGAIQLDAPGSRREQLARCGRRVRTPDLRAQHGDAEVASATHVAAHEDRGDDAGDAARSSRFLIGLVRRPTGMPAAAWARTVWRWPPPHRGRRRLGTPRRRGSLRTAALGVVPARRDRAW
jgi:hypothetical protein